MPKTANIPTARMEICLDELLRTFQLEIDNMIKQPSEQTITDLKTRNPILKWIYDYVKIFKALE